jgi:hypothetical protein
MVAPDVEEEVEEVEEVDVVISAVAVETSVWIPTNIVQERFVFLLCFCCLHRSSMLRNSKLSVILV